LIGREEEGVLSVEDWAEIRRLHRAEGLPIRMIAWVMKVSRNTVPAKGGQFSSGVDNCLSCAETGQASSADTVTTS